MVHLTINQKPVSVPEGTTIIEAAKQCGVHIPSLCYMKDIHKFGSCRICSVEVEGAKTLMASCMTEVREDMAVQTNTQRVRNARKVLYELLLSDHSKNCLSCSRNQSCELQKLGETLGVTETRFKTDSSRQSIDTSVSITRDLSKCILCRRCVTACNQIQGVGVLNAQKRGFDTMIAPAMGLPVSEANCTFCGQCTVVCPVGALRETDSTARVWQALNDPETRVVIQAAPAVRVALGELFGYPPGTSVTGKMAAAMRALGADDVFDTDWSADLTIMEEGTEFLGRLTRYINREATVLPMITSCSPGWIKYIEHYYPEQTAHLSSCKSPHMMLGAMAKTYYAEKSGIDPEKMFVVSVMPCTAKKFEITREEMKRNGIADVDAVITTRELGAMIRQAGIDFCALEEEGFDEPLGMSTGAADIFGLTGGVMEAALRTVYAIVCGRNLPFENLHVTPIVGLDRVKEATLRFENVLPAYREFEGREVRIGVTSGLAGAKQLVEQIAHGTSPYHFIEIMGCPGGCITGGGQPRSEDPKVREKRLSALYSEDEGKQIRQSHENPSIQALYAEYLGGPGSKKAHELLHTKYVKRGTFEFLTEIPAEKSFKAAQETRGQHKPQRLMGDIETVRVKTLEQENERLRDELAEMKETTDIYKQVISDYTGKGK
ncbi:NADH-dependent [FeFe] hydrogenase, group A6 [Christensenella intestinihominis]|uniref:NADH-dependent [FeFe] hydrogenase, group A6 n=1 Tax=Christensenella intestinihominis TaxID=1851429 RepID=UPI00082BF8A4|nr:NADH-dependent [FeFe] hydrogenase, group A6 [Christensenella intestinihominis]